MEEKDENRRRKNRRKSNDPLIAPPMRQKKEPLAIVLQKEKSTLRTIALYNRSPRPPRIKKSTLPGAFFYAAAQSAYRNLPIEAQFLHASVMSIYCFIVGYFYASN
jgi:hypothetical protein